MKVLVIDDDETISEFVVWVLADEGHEVVSAANGVAALQKLDGFDPDVILLDMRMPVMDGWQFARLYRDERPSPAPIVVLTAAQDVAQRASQIEAAGYLGKPFDLDELLSVVRRFDPHGCG
ncbi:MAG: response regulator [Bacteroidetes bacterium]|nr:response regulator [Bacteroidota bacterium]